MRPQADKQKLFTATLEEIVRERNVIRICSTETGNVGAQKAIQRAGFYSQHRIFEFRRKSVA